MQGPGSDGRHDDLVERVRARAADPDLRVDQVPSAFMADVGSRSVTELFGLIGSLGADLRRLQTAGVDATLSTKVGALEREMTRPAERRLPAGATDVELAAAERRLGFALPPLLRRLYAEVANGGFGPGDGIAGVAGGWTASHRRSMEDLYEEFSDADPEHPENRWPAGLLPLCDVGGPFACVDATSGTGRVVEWDPDAYDEGLPDAGWSRAFTEVAPSFEAWLEQWLGTPSHHPAANDEMTTLMQGHMDQWREEYATLSPEQRSGMYPPDEMPRPVVRYGVVSWHVPGAPDPERRPN